jgi:hypothetical protein
MADGQIRHFEFQSVLAGLMRASGQFEQNSVQEEAAVGGLNRGERVDISAVDKKTQKKVIVECKTSSGINPRHLEQISEQLERYKQHLPNSEIVLAVSSRTPPELRGDLAKLGVALWDLDQIAQRFHGNLNEVQHPILRPMLLGIASLHDQPQVPTPESILADELKAIPPGRDDWTAYQRLVKRILERLFVPPLAPPLSEKPDSDGRNRRDIILPNYSESGFWAYMRSRYAADFIVADAKNFTEEIGKDEALKILHYLKEDGAGLFGILISRKGLSEACQHALANHWIRHGKMVICLSDVDVLQMLRMKEGGDTPETVIRQAIEDFRLSL